MKRGQRAVYVPRYSRAARQAARNLWQGKRIGRSDRSFLGKIRQRFLIFGKVLSRSLAVQCEPTKLAQVGAGSSRYRRAFRTGHG
jgi:hypothetical protein